MTSVQESSTNYDMFSTRGAEQSHQYGDPNINPTKDQYDQVVSLLEHFQIQGKHRRDNLNASGPANRTVNFADIIVCISSINFGNLS